MRGRGEMLWQSIQQVRNFLICQIVLSRTLIALTLQPEQGLTSPAKHNSQLIQEAKEAQLKSTIEQVDAINLEDQGRIKNLV